MYFSFSKGLSQVTIYPNTSFCIHSIYLHRLFLHLKVVGLDIFLFYFITLFIAHGKLFIYIYTMFHLSNIASKQLLKHASTHTNKTSWKLLLNLKWQFSSWNYNKNKKESNIKSVVGSFKCGIELQSDLFLSLHFDILITWLSIPIDNHSLEFPNDVCHRGTRTKASKPIPQIYQFLDSPPRKTSNSISIKPLLILPNI